MTLKVMIVMLAAAGFLFACASRAMGQDAGGKPAAPSTIKTLTVEYKDGNTVLKGFLAYDESAKGRRPGVLVFPEWWGLNDYAKSRAIKLAELGYVALAGDFYGDGKVAKTPAEAGELAGLFHKDTGLMRSRAGAALATLRANPLVDPARLAAIGYCFGGSAALELARSGAEIAGVVSFHGGLDTPDPNDAKNIKCKVLVCTGGSDPHVDANQVARFEKEMTAAGVDWQLISYGGAVHAFTNPASGNDPSKGVAYNEKADRRSWAAMKAFFGEIFTRTQSGQ